MHSVFRAQWYETACVIWGYRTVIPCKLRNSILLEMHESHLGIFKTKELARSYVWWPTLDMEMVKVNDKRV